MDIHTGISLFSGIGGLDLGVRAVLGNHRTIAYCEREITTAQVLAERASEGLLDEAPIYSDVKSFPTELYSGKVDWVIGGFPCQPFSTAGKRKGKDDERNLWPDTIRLIRELGPRYAFLENVPGLVISGYFGTILGDLAEAGFDAEWGCFTASQVGASHKRERLFILAYRPLDRMEEPRSTTQVERSSSTGSPISSSKELAHSERGATERWRYYMDGTQRKNQEGKEERERVRPDSGPSNIELAHSEHEGYEKRVQPETTGNRSGQVGQELADTEGNIRGTSGDDRRVTSDGASNKELPEFPPGPGDPRWGWIIEQYPELAPALCKMHETEPEIRNVDDAWEIKDRVAALMMLGNAVVPAQAELALRVLLDRAGLTNLSSV